MGENIPRDANGRPIEIGRRYAWDTGFCTVVVVVEAVESRPTVRVHSADVPSLGDFTVEATELWAVKQSPEVNHE